MVQYKTTPVYVSLNIRSRQIEVAINKDAAKDHGVWVYNPSLYEKVFKLGKQLEMKVKLSERPCAKIIRVNGKEGITKLSSMLEELLSGLVEISASS